MFDNLFGFAGPLGTSFALVAILFGMIAVFAVGGRAAQLSGRAGRA